MSRCRRAKPSAHETALRALYARVPRIACKRLCADQCTLIPLTPLELEMLTAGGERPEALHVIENTLVLGSVEWEL